MGDKEGQVTVAKGKVQAIQNAMLSKNCAGFVARLRFDGGVVSR